MKKIVDEFIAFAKDEYGITLTATPSKDGEHFKDFYGYNLYENTNKKPDGEVVTTDVVV